MITHKVPPSTCPVCGTQMDAATAVEDPDGSGPEPGSLGVCWYCATILEYDANLELTKVTDGKRKEDLRKLPGLRLAYELCRERIEENKKRRRPERHEKS